MSRPKGLISSFINPQPDGTVRFFEKACLLWNDEGIITQFSTDIPEKSQLARHEILSRESFIAIPGLIDLHTHLPQYEFAAQGAEALLPWLEKYTFPQEARFADNTVAELQSLNFFQTCLSLGTTTVVAYLAAFPEAAAIAFEEAQRAGIRACLGLTLMDRNVPAPLLTSVADAEKNMLQLIEKYHGKGRNEFVVTPRFAISCSGDLLNLCGKISRAYGTLLQTHISENPDEISATLALFPDSDSYAGVYQSHGCLHEKTLLGHGIHLSQEERKIIQSNKSIIVHCPVSNNFLGSGIMPYEKFRLEGLRLGLGTDVAAGYSLSMLQEARQMLEMMKLRACWDNQPVPAGDAGYGVYQATLGNAAAMGRMNDLGSFEPGKRADIALINDALCNTIHSDISDSYATLPERLNRVIYRAHPDMVALTLIDGEVVFAR
jgi:guanine deaminase